MCLNWGIHIHKSEIRALKNDASIQFWQLCCLVCKFFHLTTKIKELHFWKYLKTISALYFTSVLVDNERITLACEIANEMFSISGPMNIATNFTRNLWSRLAMNCQSEWIRHIDDADPTVKLLPPADATKNFMVRWESDDDFFSNPPKKTFLEKRSPFFSCIDVTFWNNYKYFLMEIPSCHSEFQLEKVFWKETSFLTRFPNSFCLLKNKNVRCAVLNKHPSKKDAVSTNIQACHS